MPTKPAADVLAEIVTTLQGTDWGEAENDDVYDALRTIEDELVRAGYLPDIEWEDCPLCRDRGFATAQCEQCHGQGRVQLPAEERKDLPIL